MPYYQDYSNKKSGAQKRQDAERRGGFDDEGSRYSGRGGSRGDRPQGNRNGGYGDRPQGNRSNDRSFGGDNRGNDRGGYRSDRPQGNRGNDRSFGGDNRGNDRGGYRGDRPQGNRGNDRSFGGDNRGNDRGGYRSDRPQGNRGNDRSFGGDNRGYRNDRPQGNRDGADFRFAQGKVDGYRGRGNSFAPRSFDEQRRDRKDYQSFRYETPERPPRPTYDAPEQDDEELVPNENLLSGRNPIREALKSGRDIEKMLVARGDLSGSAREIIAMAKEQRVPIQEVDRSRLDAITPNHQGMLAFASAYKYHTVAEMLDLAEQKNEAPFLVILDGITDPHNLGAIIRTAECAGAHGVIVQERRAVGLTPAAVKASAGAIEHIMVARVTNLVSTIADLKQRNVWTYAADMDGEDYAGVDFKGGAAIIIGAEGEGVSRLVLENCDKRVSLPIRGKLDSLNASVAAGVLLYAVLRSR